MIKTTQLIEISNLIERLDLIKSDKFIIEGGLKLFNKDDAKTLIGFIVHDNGEWSYSPPVIPIPSQSSIAVPSGVVNINNTAQTPPGFEARMGTPPRTVTPVGRSEAGQADTLNANFLGVDQSETEG